MTDLTCSIIPIGVMEWEGTTETWGGRGHWASLVLAVRAIGIGSIQLCLGNGACLHAGDLCSIPGLGNILLENKSTTTPGSCLENPSTVVMGS